MNEHILQGASSILQGVSFMFCPILGPILLIALSISSRCYAQSKRIIMLKYGLVDQQNRTQNESARLNRIGRNIKETP